MPIRASAWYDLVITAGFATPWTYALLHGTLSQLGSALGISGRSRARHHRRFAGSQGDPQVARLDRPTVERNPRQLPSGTVSRVLHWQLLPACGPTTARRKINIETSFSLVTH
ncbi:hypothetical protein [Micromonospora sp. NPDC047740]|uniref:hypothetical protein n=1 Tax=Micromonospora sp. NPDC047740 TaxID=3364254 RepID=UPI0037229C22